MSQTNFLIGRGELLTHDIKGPKRMPGKAEVYTLAQAVQRLAPQFSATATALDTLAPLACPGDFGVARLTMNPSYIARSFFPMAMLRTVGLESVGSRTVKVMPGGWTKKGDPQECTTTELFVAGNADTKSFFDMKKYATEEERRSDMGKWETVLHGAKNMRGSSLKNPVFDIHYNARESGHRANGAEKIRYALIITVEAPKHADLYNEILRAYAKTLVPIQPQVSLPIRV